MNFNNLQHALGVQFKSENLLKQAFTHSSYVNEHRKKDYKDNERLEFLGDAVLELGVSQYLFREYPKMAEGELTKFRASVVCEASLANFAKDLNFGPFILLGKGEEMTGGRNRPALLADVFESFIGALYLDQGFDTVIGFLEDNVYPKITKGAFSHAMDYKSQLQELVQQNKNGTVEYLITDERGPAHNREFVAQATVLGEVVGVGYGKTKKEAEQRAAKKTIDEFGEGLM